MRNTAQVLKRERRIKLAAFFTILAVSATILLAVDFMLISCVLAFVANYLLSPLVNVLERRHVPRQFAILIPFVSAAVLLGIGIYLILPLITQQLSLLESQLPRYQMDLMSLIERTEHRFKGFFSLYNINFSEELNNWIAVKTTDLSRTIPRLVSGSITVTILTPFFAFFMLQDGRRVSRALLSFVPNDLFELALSLNYKLNEQMGGFIRARFLEAAIVGLVVGVGLGVVDFPYAALLGVFAGVMNLVPYIGPIIGAVPAVLIAMVSEDAMIASTMNLTLIFVTSIYFLAQLIDIVFIIPFVVAKIVNLHPVTVIIVIIVGSQVMGILGMMISIPVASALKLIFQTFYRHLTELRSS